MDTRGLIKQILTPDQQKKYDAIKWLVSGEQSTGRTRVLASALIETALETGKKVIIYDHSIFTEGLQTGYGFEMLFQINQIADILKKHIEIEISHNSIATFLSAKWI